MTICQLRWHTTNRYYTAILQKDLFGDLLLTCAWGGVNSRLGNQKHIHFANQSEARLYLDKLSKRRTSRGYDLTMQLSS
jgi:predicted DNA-binding WGR domain protein